MQYDKVKITAWKGKHSNWTVHSIARVIFHLKTREISFVKRHYVKQSMCVFAQCWSKYLGRLSRLYTDSQIQRRRLWYLVLILPLYQHLFCPSQLLWILEIKVTLVTIESDRQFVSIQHLINNQSFETTWTNLLRFDQLPLQINPLSQSTTC